MLYKDQCNQHYSRQSEKAWVYTLSGVVVGILKINNLVTVRTLNWGTSQMTRPHLSNCYM